MTTKQESDAIATAAARALYDQAEAEFLAAMRKTANLPLSEAERLYLATGFAHGVSAGVKITNALRAAARTPVSGAESVPGTGAPYTGGTNPWGIMPETGPAPSTFNAYGVFTGEPPKHGGSGGGRGKWNFGAQ